MAHAGVRVGRGDENMTKSRVVDRKQPPEVTMTTEMKRTLIMMENQEANTDCEST